MLELVLLCVQLPVFKLAQLDTFTVKLNGDLWVANSFSFPVWLGVFSHSAHFLLFQPVIVHLPIAKHCCAGCTTENIETRLCSWSWVKMILLHYLEILQTQTQFIKEKNSWIWYIPVFLTDLHISHFPCSYLGIFILPRVVIWVSNEFNFNIQN